MSKRYNKPITPKKKLPKVDGTKIVKYTIPGRYPWDSPIVITHEK